jgi:hypothetical protein
MRWIIDGRWRHNVTGNVYEAKFFVITKENEDPVQVLNDNYDLSGMTYLRGNVTPETEIKAALISPFVFVEETNGNLK